VSEPRTVWVTGAASGMGAVHARRFAERGDRLGLLDVTEDALVKLADEIRGAGGRAEPVVADITDWDALRAGAARLRESLGPAQVVVANAGIIGDGTEVADLEPDAWRRVLDVNLTGSFLTTKAAVPQLREAAEPRSMVLISSICGLTASQGFAAYNASKHGVIGLMRTLAHELGPDGIRVNAVCPGWIDTPMLAASLEDAGADSGDLSGFTSMNLIERLIDSEEVTEAVLWLTSPRSRALTGVVLPVDLGLMENRAWP
jgi:NAD(P)-dependent dehydrogenase (short-subunit alcohol dehydrogenase family)